jgi:hypothetical protein
VMIGHHREVPRLLHTEYGHDRSPPFVRGFGMGDMRMRRILAHRP